VTTTEQIKQLREQTGAGVLEAKRVLDEHGGDFQKALSILKAKGLAAADKKAEREAREGVIECYVHAGGKVGVLVEVNCETDFVARLDSFKQLAHDIALQIAAISPRYVLPDDIPADVLAQQKKTFEEAARAEGKPEAIIPKIVQGKLDKYYRELCLYRQPFIKDDSMTIEELVKTAIAQTKENIVVRRFVRYALGE
jgi:elongation factor Ts